MVNGAGAGVDAQGRAVMDPTANVKDIIDAAMQRQDDLREQESRHIREIMGLRSQSAADLRKAEAGRLDAIRAVDVAAAQLTASVAETRAATLAAQVTDTAEALRSEVGSTAAAAQVSLAAALVPIQDSVAALLRSQYEGIGQKTQVTETQAEGIGQRQSAGLWLAAAAAVSAFFLGVAGVVIAIVLK